MKKFERNLSMVGFDPTISWNDRKTVHTAWIRIATILNEIGLSNLPKQKLSIKSKMDTNPPAGAELKTLIVNRHMIFSLKHHDLPSLMAGKIHALITRTYLKGRDWHDLLWYRAQRPAVLSNLKLLQNALDQTPGAGKFTATEWSKDICKRLDTLKSETLKDDVLPFLENPGEASMLTTENLKSLLQTSSFSS